MTHYTHGIPGQILRGQFHSPNEGISAYYEDVIIVGANVPPLRPVTDRAPAVVIGETLPGYVVLWPDVPVPAGSVGYMASGAYVAPTEGRQEWRKVFGHYGAIPLHDRIETQAQYDANFD